MKQILWPFLVATTNLKKLEELRCFLTGLPLAMETLCGLAGYQKIEETGASFEENAERKALGYAAQSGKMTLAEDSGLCVDALDGAPGIYSSRYGGIEGDDERNNRRLLEALREVPSERRSAHYVSVIAIAEPGRLIGTVRGEVHGRIAESPQGSNGFGYDPLFYYPDFRQTFGQAAPERKAKVSHRARAYEKAKELLERYLPEAFLKGDRDSGGVGNGGR
ncbi:MAG: RdgB/HAM1 family non-canonical purine NTP pyrophosphatase [Candidatus Omnitrophota bacterium]